MGALINDLLQLLRVTQAEMNLQDVDLSAEVSSVCGLLRARDPGARSRCWWRTASGSLRTAP
jgi:hypothetical protein